MPTITCTSCGERSVVGVRGSNNRKRCRICQVLYDGAGRLESRECEDCGTTYWPLRRNWKRCGHCSVYVFDRINSPVCGGCGERRPAADGTDNTCLRCIQSSEKWRNLYVKRLYEIYEERVAKNFPETSD